MTLSSYATITQFLIAQAAPAPAPTGPGLGGMLPMFIMLFAIMYFLMIRPQQKRDRERRDMLSKLAKGDEVVTTGGICGTVVGLTEANVVLKVNDNVTIQFVRGAISQVVSRGETKAK